VLFQRLLELDVAQKAVTCKQSTRHITGIEIKAQFCLIRQNQPLYKVAFMYVCIHNKNIYIYIYI